MYARPVGGAVMTSTAAKKLWRFQQQCAVRIYRSNTNNLFPGLYKETKNTVLSCHFFVVLLAVCCQRPIAFLDQLFFSHDTLYFQFTLICSIKHHI